MLYLEIGGGTVPGYQGFPIRGVLTTFLFIKTSKVKITLIGTFFIFDLPDWPGPEWRRKSIKDVTAFNF